MPAWDGRKCGVAGLQNPFLSPGMVPFALPLLAAAAGSPALPDLPRGRAEVVARATVEIVAAVRVTSAAPASEPRRQVRRNAAGQITVEFE